MEGVVKISFNDTLWKPLNLTLLYEKQALKFQVINGRTGTINESIQNVTDWKFVDFDSKSIEVKLLFSYPRGIA